MYSPQAFVRICSSGVLYSSVYLSPARCPVLIIEENATNRADGASRLEDERVVLLEEIRIAMQLYEVDR